MSFSCMRGLRRGIVLLASGTVLAPGALAQNQAEFPPGAVVQPTETGPGAEWRRNLTTLADNPRSMAALVGAGRAALAMGDAEAAYNFFERANEVEPGSARAKAGMASALVQLERAREALPLFAEALALGAPEAEIAGDRGLAHDVLGDPGRAQADYALALRHGDDPEIRRRMALSLAISGQREPALRMIEGQLRVHNRAAWRTQAFVLALTGDSTGAERTARSVMPPAAAEEMAPFFRRLAGLGPAQKALAVHFGRFPSGGAAGADVALAQADPPPAPPRERPRPAEPVNSDEQPASLAAGASLGEVAPPVERPAPAPALEPEPEPSEPAPQQQTEPAAAQGQEQEPVTAPADAATAGFTLVPQGTQPVLAATEPPPSPPPPSPPPPAQARSRLEDLTQVVASLPADAERRETRTPRTAQARPAPTAARIPARHWVQLAHAARASLLPREFTEAEEKAPALLKNRAPYTAFADRTNRLLIGPFDSRAAAQAFVRRLAGRDVPALAWTSPAGQEIERLRIPNEPRSSRTSRSEPEQRPAARPSRGRSQPEQRPAARGSRPRQ